LKDRGTGTWSIIRSFKDGLYSAICRSSESGFRQSQGLLVHMQLFVVGYPLHRIINAGLSRNAIVRTKF